MPRTNKIFLGTESPQIASIITSKLGRDGFSVLCKSNGVEAFQSMLSEPPDLAVLDSILPDLNAYEILQKLRAHPGTQKLPVFILLDVLQEHSEEEFVRGGADMVFIKPFRPTNLSKKIRKTLAASETKESAHV
jgi:DNA-binding response OmpR family regulator